MSDRWALKFSRVVEDFVNVIADELPQYKLNDAQWI